MYNLKRGIGGAVKRLEELREWYALHEKGNLEDFFTFLRFPSISADLAYSVNVRQTAEFLIDYLTKIGLKATLWETSGHPVVFASHEAGEGFPTLLLYNHYDVQPVDPLELWETPPFEPKVRDGSVYARGAQDNKGQCFYTLLALKKAFEGGKKLPFNLKVFIEGEEESGGSSTTEILKTREDELKADYVLLVDGGIRKLHIPEISMGTRGIVALDLVCKIGELDLHSGMHGGIALNANRVLCKIVDRLWSEDGSIAIPDFYKSVEPLTQEERELLDLEFDAESYLRESKVFGIAREDDFSPLEANLLRPSLEINGISGGYAGKGFKTVIPCEARCKLSCRIVPGQDPEEVVGQICSFLKAELPQGAQLSFTIHHGAPAFRSTFGTEFLKLAVAAFEEIFEAPCRFSLCGATIPIIGDLAQAANAEALLIGLGLSEDQIHAPNEHFGLDRLEKGFLLISRIFDRIKRELE